MDPLTIGSLALSGVTKLIGEGVAARKRKNALETRNAYYDYAGSLLDSQYYRDPLTTVGNRSILKEAKKNYADNIEAIENRAVATGATVENELATRQANNENLDKLQLRLLQNEDARRERNRNQKLNLEGQRAQDNANAYLQQAQDWQSWGAAGANAILDFGRTGLLGDTSSELSASEWAEMAPDVSGIQRQLTASALQRDALYPHLDDLSGPTRVGTGLGLNELAGRKLGGLTKK